MRRLLNRRIVLASCSVLLLGGSVLVACNALVGIEDVRLRSDAAPSGDEEPVIDDDLDSGDGAARPRENLLEVALGRAHVCARRPDGTVRCWGDDRNGQTGTGATADGGLRSEPADVIGIDDAVDIASGRAHSCVVHETGKVSCWGFNNDGQLGNGQLSTTASTPKEVANLGDAVAVAAGATFTCAVRSGGGVACWGNNGAGQLGTGDTTASPSPISVTGLRDVVAIAAGQLHACAVRSDGTVSCWGEGANGQLGNGGTSSTPSPAPVSALPASIRVAATERSTCALTAEGTVYCWGANEAGQLGNGAANSAPNPSPILVSKLGDAIAIAAGENHVCATRRGGTVVCWGAGSAGQLGDGRPRDAGSVQATLVTADGIVTAIGVGAGGNSSCAPLSTGAIECWGANDRGQLGNRTLIGERSPVAVIGYP